MRKSLLSSHPVHPADLSMWGRSRLAHQGYRKDALPTVRLRAGSNHLRKPVYDNAPAERYRSGRVRLLASPCLTLGVAADDFVRVDPHGHFKVIERSQNVAVHWYTDHGIDRLHRMIDAVEGVGGWLDGHIPRRALVLTFPIRVGLSVIEATLDGNITDDEQWHFGNVYGENDVALSWVLPFL